MVSGSASSGPWKVISLRGMYHLQSYCWFLLQQEKDRKLKGECWLKESKKKGYMKDDEPGINEEKYLLSVKQKKISRGYFGKIFQIIEIIKSVSITLVVVVKLRSCSNIDVNCHY